MKGILRDLYRALIFPQFHSSCACILCPGPCNDARNPPILAIHPLPRLHRGIYWHQILGPKSLWNPASSRIHRVPYHWTCWSRSWSRKRRGHVRGPSSSSTWKSRDEHCAPPLWGSCGCALSQKSGKPSDHLERIRCPRGGVPDSVQSVPGCRRGPQVLPLFPLGPRLSGA